MNLINYGLCPNNIENLLPVFIYVVFASYIIGSIPFGLILTKVFCKTDIRQIGSGNIGATNVLRTGNKKLAASTLALDAGKGGFAIGILFFLAYNSKIFPHPSIFTSPNYSHCSMINNMYILLGTCSALFAILGHCYPIWLKFKGGKGVATALGALLAAVPIAGLAACAAWLITAKFTKISSLSALVAIAITPIVTLFIYGSAPATVCVLISLLVWLRHRENIKRLLAGTEPKIGAKKKEEEQDNPQS